MPFFSGSQHYQNCIWIWSFPQTSYWAHQTIQVLTVDPHPSSPKSASNYLQHSLHLECKNMYVVPELQPSNAQPLHTVPLQSIFLTNCFHTVPVWRVAFPLSHTDLLERQIALQRAAHLVPDLLGVKCHSDLYLQGLWHQCCTPTWGLNSSVTVLHCRRGKTTHQTQVAQVNLNN